MRAVRVLVSRLLDVVVGGRRDRRVADEVQQHLDLLVDEHMGRGLSRADAEWAAPRDSIAPHARRATSVTTRASGAGCRKPG